MIKRVAVIVALPVVWVVMSSGGASAAGVAVFKEQVYHDDSSAIPIAYIDFKDNGVVVSVRTRKREFTVEKQKCIARIDVHSDFPQMLIDETQMAPFRSYLNELKTFAARFPKSEPLLRDQMTALTEHIGKFDAGEVRYKGKWITKQAYADIEAKYAAEMARMAAEAKEQSEQIKIAAEMAKIARPLQVLMRAYPELSREEIVGKCKGPVLSYYLTNRGAVDLETLEYLCKQNGLSFRENVDSLFVKKKRVDFAFYFQ